MNKINNAEFIKQISKKTNYTQGDIKAVITAIAEIVTDNLINGDSTVIFNGLTIEPKEVSATTKRNPRDGSIINVPAHKSVKAKFGTKIKDAIR